MITLEQELAGGGASSSTEDQKVRVNSELLPLQTAIRRILKNKK